MMNAQPAPAPSQSKRSFEPSAPSSSPAHASKQQGHAVRLNSYRRFYRVWLAVSVLWVPWRVPQRFPSPTSRKPLSGGWRCGGPRPKPVATDRHDHIPAFSATKYH